MPRCLRLVVCLAVLALPSRAFAAPIDFETLVDGVSLTDQLFGLTFSNATVLSAGISLNEFEFPPLSGSNVVFDDGGPMSIAFAAPLASFGGYFTYLTQLTLEAFSPAHVSLGAITSAFNSNLALSGDPGSVANEFLQLAFASGVGFVTITGSRDGGSFVLDDATVTALPAGQPVPEPGTLGLMLLGAAAWRVQRTRSRRVSASI